MMYKLFNPLIIGACAAILAACAGSAALEQDTTEITGIVATVNGIPIKKAEYKQELDTTYARFHQSGQIVDGRMYEQLKEEVRNSLINLILMDQHSHKLSIDVDEASVESYFQKAVAKYPSRKAYHKSLKEAGLTESDLKSRIKRTLAAQKVVETLVKPKVDVTDKEVRAYYDDNPLEFEHGVQVHAAHILIKVSPLADKEARANAKKRILAIKEKITAGEDFATLAKTHSEGPSKVNGGDLGYFGSAQMSPAFETAAFSLKPNEVSDVVTTQFGFHLIKVYDRKPAGKEPFSEAGPILRDRFYKERLDAQLQELVQKLVSEAQIERLPLD